MYRTAEAASPVLDCGPRDSCPACGARTVERSDGSGRMESCLGPPRACSPGRRLRIGWLARCAVPGEHVHQACKVCGHAWQTEFKTPRKEDGDA
jgi:rRNA maturation endonuclease Nob1